jgi:formate dehydrogenase major subunit
MDVSRRDFLKISGGTAALGTLGSISLDTVPAEASVPKLRIENAKVTTTVCPYCSVGCSILVYAKDGKVINTEGDPESPINEGSLCPKGASLWQMANNPTRVLKPLYRAPGGKEWKEVEWDWALDQIAHRVKDTREKTFRTKTISMVKERTTADPDWDKSGLYTQVERTAEREFAVNRTDGIAHVGSAALDNEECYLLQKLLRSWGLVWIEHQARV